MADRPLKNKELKDIRPATGVKTKPKKQKANKPIQNSQVIHNVAPPPDTLVDQLEPPTEEAIKLVNKINDAKQLLILAMRKFNKLLSDTTLQENKSEKEKQQEVNVINELILATEKVEMLQPKEGLMSLCVFATRLSLSLRNVNNLLSHKMYQLENRIEQLEKTIGVDPPKEDPKAREKKLLIEQAEKLGIKINIED